MHKLKKYVSRKFGDCHWKLWEYFVLVYHRGLVVKNLPAKQETWVQLLSQEDPLEKEMPTHFSN